MTQKKFYIKTLGCKVNQYESQVIRENFLKNGYIQADSSEEADICVVNTCTVTSTSDSKSLKLIRSGLGKKNKCIIATGCMIESSDMDLRKLKGVDFIIKNKDKYRIPEIASSSASGGLLAMTKGNDNSITRFEGHARAFIKIQDGCNNGCSYCKVRIVRGSSVSKPLRSVLDECKTIIDNGYREIVLTGICLGAYGRDISKDMNLPGLIKEICKIKGNWRMRLSSIEPKDVTGDLVDLIKSEEKLCKHLHIPFQSGDNEILKKMNRPYKADDYAGIVNKLRKAIPDIAISTDMMVGFPGEKDANFESTVSFIKEIRPMRMHVFGFSRRLGTSAYSCKDNISGFLKKKREHILMDIANNFAMDFEKAFAGKKAKVLVEDKRDKQGFLSGYTDRYIKVLIDGPDTIKSSLITCQVALTNQKAYGILLSYLE